jgi:hypothetical protein
MSLSFPKADNSQAALGFSHFYFPLLTSGRPFGFSHFGLRTHHPDGRLAFPLLVVTIIFD